MNQAVRCECGTLFGIQQIDGTLAIKYRDLNRVVSGTVSGPCRKCGEVVTWTQVVTTIPQPGWMTNSATYTCNCTCTQCMSGSCCLRVSMHPL